MKQIFTTLFILFLTVQSQAQCYPVLTKMKKQTQYYSDEAYDRNFPYFYRATNLYVSGGAPNVLQYGYWDGNNWNKLGPNRYRGNPLRLLMWDNQIIGFGRITEMDSLKAPARKYFGVMKYNNGKWDTIPGCTFDSGTNIQVCAYKYGLFLKINDINNSIYKGYIYKYDTASLGFKKIINYEGYNYRTTFSAGDKRMLISNVSKINGVSTNGFAYIENDSIKLCNSSNFEEQMVYTIDKVTDHIYATYLRSDPLIYEFGNTALPVRKTKLTIIGAYDPLQVYNGQLIWQSFDNTPKNKYYNILCPGDSIWNQIYFLRTNDIITTNPYASVNGIYGELYSNGKSTQMVLGNGAELKGTAFIDKDSNCVIGNSEHRLKNYPILAQSAYYYSGTQTDDSGRFHLFVPLDTISLNGPGTLSKCANNKIVTTQNNNSYTKNIPVKTPNGSDVRIKFLHNHSVRWNSNTAYGAIIENHGAPLDSIQFQFALDNKLSVLNTDSNFYNIQANIAKGHLYNLDYYEKRWVNLNTWIDTATTKPDSIVCNSAFAYSNLTDIDSSNNRDSACQMVVYSLDPNYKLCVQKTIPPIQSSRLEYYIEFQNEGNDDAYDVVVVDALSNKLDMRTLELISCSHPYTMEIGEGQMKLNFKNIFLKPKKLDEAKSKGYIHFYINTVKNLKVGDSISNNAYIYFDLNAAVITNTSVVKIEYSTDIESNTLVNQNQLTVYPNPANNEVNILSMTDEKVYIYNLLGEVVFESSTSNGSLNIDCSKFVNGLYIVRCGNLSAKLIKN